MVYTLRPGTPEKRKHPRQVRAEVSSAFFPAALVTRKGLGQPGRRFRAVVDQACCWLRSGGWELREPPAALCARPPGSAFPVPASESWVLILIPPGVAPATPRLLTPDPELLFLCLSLFPPSCNTQLEASVWVSSPGGRKFSEGPCSAWCPNPWAGREEASKTMQLTKREVYYWLESGLSAATNAVVQGQKKP